jgi:hypothetical protein
MDSMWLVLGRVEGCDDGCVLGELEGLTGVGCEVGRELGCPDGRDDGPELGDPDG